ncbi:MAG: chaperone NapD [Sutterellaceae bacterium]|nr:chaperone NapD [Sutterellaceae bacterium]MDD7442996.1 chaperone NapD [Sutterellaceae bacterium]MDY2868736.1 chaperone NapD [Mesosutterella sp.]
MYYSAVLVTAKKGEFAEAVSSVEGKGLEVFQKDEATSRFIAVIEGETVGSEADSFRDLIGLPGVETVSLVVNQEDTESSAS